MWHFLADRPPGMEGHMAWDVITRSVWTGDEQISNRFSMDARQFFWFGLNLFSMPLSKPQRAEG